MRAVGDEAGFPYLPLTLSLTARGGKRFWQEEGKGKKGVFDDRYFPK